MIAFAKAYALACIGVLPLVVLIAGFYAPFFYIYIAGIGIASILVFGILTGIWDSYRYKFAVFAGAVGYYAYALRDTLSQTLPANQLNPNLLLFVYLMFLFPVAYLFLERHRIRQHFSKFTAFPPELEN